MGNVSRIFVSVAKFLRRELVAAWPVFLFFLVGFLLLLLLIKLALANFSIEVTALSKAVIGALLAAKAALILDETPLARRLDQYRRIVAVAVKTILYGSITLLLGYMERILDALHRVHNFGAAVRYVSAHANVYRLFAWALGISLVFLSTSCCQRSINAWAKVGFGHCSSSLPKFTTIRAGTRTRQSSETKRPR